MPLWRPGLARRRERSTDRLPPGQRRVTGWPVLHEGRVPTFDPQTWRLRVWGACEQPLELTWDELMALPRHETVQDFHCVTTWSRFDNHWAGVAVVELLRRARPTAACTHALVHSYDAVGYTTNMALDDLARPDNLVATHHDGQPLAPAHGGPVRLVVHHLYAWKSCKWLGGIELLTENRRGYWEQRGYHDHADPWLEERYAYQEE
ncbi:MAG: sulfite oxidase-like oxidoreductase [Deltaproteobacteria bacterium]|nr:MAG: sulfite oxidase-like oxidoreductase [Deltaproteobacteria bacterium]